VTPGEIVVLVLGVNALFSGILVVAMRRWGLRGPRGERGPAGPQGQRGEPGRDGSRQPPGFGEP
jgi:hypothetical protein